MALPLSIGASGEEIRDLHRRLSSAGHRVTHDTATYTAATVDAVRSFQQAHGLEDSGTCDETTWNTLVEASYALGDRTLYQTRPMLRGDDIADLQLRLGSLGFDAGRSDGIFGPQTERAVADFQRNAGLTSDGVAGPQTISELIRLSARADVSRPVALVARTSRAARPAERARSVSHRRRRRRPPAGARARHLPSPARRRSDGSRRAPSRLVHPGSPRQ